MFFYSVSLNNEEHGRSSEKLPAHIEQRVAREKPCRTLFVRNIQVTNHNRHLIIVGYRLNKKKFCILFPWLKKKEIIYYHC